MEAQPAQLARVVSLTRLPGAIAIVHFRSCYSEVAMRILYLTAHERGAQRT
ncbi:MAG: hypothetical protein OJF49_001432 [Ktedonobacterales bacterium]|nr:MAG: hypothetical protein OJF49_001432 [Ktedonobacterales bacterium]